MNLTGENLVGDEPVKGSGTTFRAVNPATGAELEPPFREADDAIVDRALRGTEAVSLPYAGTPPAVRAGLLRGIADEIQDLGQELLDRAHEETALPPARLESERTRTTSQLRLFASLLDEGSWVEARIDPGDPARTPVPKPDIRRMLIPLGPVAVFAASNFPLAFSVAGGDTAAALAAGCPVVCKAHPAHPGTSELVARAIGRAARGAGLEPHIFSLVHGWSPDVGLALARHPLTRAVAFTGSFGAGRALFDAAAARPVPIPVYAEMGSVNPVFLLPSALAERCDAIAEGLAQSITLGAGQFCTNPGVVVGVRGDGLDRLRRLLAERLGASPPGVMLYARLGEAYAAALERARARGALVLTAPAAPPAPARAGAALLGTYAARFAGDAEWQEEIFGPASLVVEARDAAELMRVAEALGGQLTAAIHGSPDELAAHAPLVEMLRRKAGRLIFNGFPTGVEVGHAMQHGGPYPASTDSRSTSVGTASIARFLRPVCYQDFPDAALPAALRNRNALGIWRRVDGELTQDDVRPPV
ncbi:MAG TPA: aldehyde dehydrogenase (NADP(+)) [Gemmatimonadales bacterium]|nr:aldehyde dehydrogenase (NADP(+)) [Gemmatimonadales bacterium]